MTRVPSYYEPGVVLLLVVGLLASRLVDAALPNDPKQIRIHQMQASCFNKTRYVCTENEDKAVCLRRLYQQFLRDLPVDMATLERMHQSGRLPPGWACIHRPLAPGLRPLRCESEVYESRQQYSTCPWKWEITDRGVDMYPRKRESAKCICTNCHSYKTEHKLRAVFLINSSSCRPVTTFMPALVAKEGGRVWKFYLEPVAIGCYCGTEVKFRRN